MTELAGQTNLFEGMEYAEQEAGEPTGYDRDGNLMDYVPGELAERPLTMDVLTDEARALLIAGEINAIKAQVRRATLAAAVEIGRKLIEARALVPHGRWLDWLSTHVNYSDRTAQNLIAVFEEYGKNPNPQALSDLSYTQAVALLGLPAEQRDALIDSGAANLSTRELEAEVKRLREENGRQQLTLAELEAKAETAALDARREKEDAERAAAEYARKLKAAKEAKAALKKQNSAFADRSAQDAQRASDAVNRANKSDQALKEARARIEELEAREPEKVVELPPEAAQELERLRDQARRAPSEAVIRLRAGYERLADEIRNTAALLEAVKAEDPETAAKYGAALEKAAEAMKARIGEVLA